MRQYRALLSNALSGSLFQANPGPNVDHEVFQAAPGPNVDHEVFQAHPGPNVDHEVFQAAPGPNVDLMINPKFNPNSKPLL